MRRHGQRAWPVLPGSPGHGPRGAVPPTEPGEIRDAYLRYCGHRRRAVWPGHSRPPSRARRRSAGVRPRHGVLAADAGPDAPPLGVGGLAHLRPGGRVPARRQRGAERGPAAPPGAAGAVRGVWPVVPARSGAGPRHAFGRVGGAHRCGFPAAAGRRRDRARAQGGGRGGDRGVRKAAGGAGPSAARGRFACVGACKLRRLRRPPGPRDRQRPECPGVCGAPERIRCRGGGGRPRAPLPLAPWRTAPSVARAPEPLAVPLHGRWPAGDQLDRGVPGPVPSAAGSAAGTACPAVRSARQARDGSFPA